MCYSVITLCVVFGVMVFVSKVCFSLLYGVRVFVSNQVGILKCRKSPVVACEASQTCG